MDSIFERIIALRGYNISMASEEIKKIQSMNIERFKKWQNEKRWDMVKYHFNHNEFYKAKLNNILPSDWSDVPIMQKSDYQQSISKLISEGFNTSSLYIANTSGSSGHPFFFAKNKFCHSMTWALIKSRYSTYKINMNSKQARFFGISLKTSSWINEKLKDYIMNRVRFPVFDMSNEKMEVFISLFEKKKFLYIYGYVNALVLFSRKLIEDQKTLKEICPSLKYCITTSEMLTSFDRDILEKGFGIPIINEYGVSEAGGLVAIEDPGGNWLINRETAYIEIVGEDGKQVPDGHEGSIIITDLYNKAMPFIRYNVGDIGLIKKHKTINGYKILDKLIGRTNDNIILPSGKVSPGLTFYYISRSILESSGILKEFIIRQTSVDTFIFDVVSNEDIRENDIKSIKIEMDRYLEPGLHLKINRVKKIKRSNSGKLKHFFSELTINKVNKDEKI